MNKRLRTRTITTTSSEDGNRSNIIRELKQEIIRLKDLVQDKKKSATNRDDTGTDDITQRPCQLGVAKPRSNCDGECKKDAYDRIKRELSMCKNELRDARESLELALREQDRIRAERDTPPRDSRQPDDVDSHRLAWVGKCYLSAMLPEDHMFRPGETVTPSRVLHKLFEVRVGTKIATGFTVLLENAHLLLASLDYTWYKKHFSLYGEHQAGYRIDTEMFVWLLFEYGAHAPMIEIIATHQSLLLSAGKCGVTTLALNTNKLMYSAYVSLFRETVVSAHKEFMAVREYAYKVYLEQRHVYVPVTAGLQNAQHERDGDGDTAHLRSRALRSVLESLPVPVPVQTDKTNDFQRTRRADLDPLDNALSDFIRLRPEYNSTVGNGQKRQPTREQYCSAYNKPAPDDRLHKRVTFNSDWAHCRYMTSPYQRDR